MLPPSADSTDTDQGHDSALSARQGQGSRLISRLLPPAIRLWLQTQLDHIEGLNFRILGQDRQILKGYVPQVAASAQQAVYRGLQVSQVTVTATDIHVNLGQVVRGKPLKLLQSFPVSGQVCLQAQDLQVSLGSALLSEGLQDLLHRLLQAHPTLEALPAGATPQVSDIHLASDQLTLIWSWGAEASLMMTSSLKMVSGRWLCLGQPTLVTSWPPGLSPSPAHPVRVADVTFDLGPETNIHTLTITPDAITLAGTVRVVAPH
jgi:hypothetical protein